MFRWGIIGSGYVARKFVLDLKNSKDGKATLVFSRQIDNARAFARDFGVDATSTSIEQAVKAGVDAFYIATPPSAHRSNAIACLEAGKPVLLEKPFAQSYEDAVAIVETARSTGTFCMEGLWTRFLPLMGRLKQMLASNAIGEIRSFSGSFGASNRPEPADNRFVPSAGGGALLHRGIYPLSIALDLLGGADLVATSGRIGATGVDEDNVLVLRHRSGAISTLRSSLRAPLANDFTIEGTHGTIHVHAPIYRPFALKLTRTQPSGHARGGASKKETLLESSYVQMPRQYADPLLKLAGGKTFRDIYRGNGYHYEADEVADCVRQGKPESGIMPLSASLALARHMEDAMKQWTGVQPENGDF